jgi:16S rRNA (cytidine1402-2'-O)-methyltransferase
LAELAAALGAREAAVARELTKRFEEVRRGTLTALAQHYAAAGPPRGEVVLVIGPPAQAAALAAEDLDSALQEALATMSPAAAAASVAAATGIARREVYRRALALKAVENEEQ